MRSVLLLWLVLVSGCTPLHPWERGRLLTEVMSDPLDPLQAGIDEHVFATREAMLGGAGAGGASCGCD